MESLINIQVEKRVSSLRAESGINTNWVNKTYRRRYKVKTVSGTKRFTSFCVDLFIIAIALIGLEALSIRKDYQIAAYFVSIPIVYALCEYIWQQTPGKMIMNLVVINEYAEGPDFKTCLLRSLIRLIPVEALSCTGARSRGWHDRWTKTYVVTTSQLPDLKELVQRESPVIVE